MNYINGSTQLIKIETGEYPVYISKVRRDNANVSLPIEPSEELLLSLGYAVVNPVARPEGDVVLEGTPQLVDGKYVQVWDVRSFSEEEIAQQLEKKKHDLNRNVMEMRDKELDQGFEHITASGEVFGVQTRLEDRVNMLYLNMNAEKMVATGDETLQEFRSTENITYMLTPSEMVAMTNEALGFYKRILGASWVLKDLISAAKTIAELPVLPAKLAA